MSHMIHTTNLAINYYLKNMFHSFLKAQFIACILVLWGGKYQCHTTSHTVVQVWSDCPLTIEQFVSKITIYFMWLIRDWLDIILRLPKYMEYFWIPVQFLSALSAILHSLLIQSLQMQLLFFEKTINSRIIMLQTEYKAII